MTLPTKKTTFTFNHDDQVDELGLQIGVALTIQQLFDTRAQELLVYLNAVRDALVAITGAGEIGATNADLTATTVQGQIDELLVAIGDIVAGAVPDGSITLVKLAGDVETYFDTQYNNYAHPTGDGNLHVPVTSTNNNNRVLTAGATAGSLSWTPKRHLYSGDDTEKTHAGATLTTIKTVRVLRTDTNGFKVSRINVGLEGNVSAGTGTFQIWVNGSLLFTLPTTTSTSYVVLQGNSAVTWTDNTVNTVELKVQNSGAGTTRCRLFDVYVEE